MYYFGVISSKIGRKLAHIAITLDIVFMVLCRDLKLIPIEKDGDFYVKV